MKYRKGLTLIELIISIALIGIIAITMFGALDTSLINISKAGKRTEDVLQVKTNIDEEISGYNGIGNDVISIKLPGVDDPEVINGMIIEKSFGSVNNTNIVIRTFIPNTGDSTVTPTE